jgi:hypothetical protein
VLLLKIIVGIKKHYSAPFISFFLLWYALQVALLLLLLAGNTSDFDDGDEMMD